MNENNIVFIDEVGFNVFMKTLYGKSLAKPRVINKVNFKDQEIC